MFLKKLEDPQRFLQCALCVPEHAPMVNYTLPDYKALEIAHLDHALATEGARKKAEKGGRHKAEVLGAYCNNVYELASCMALPRSRPFEAFENVEQLAVKAQACAQGGPGKSAGTACWEGFMTILLAVHAVVREHDFGNYQGNVLRNWLGYREAREGDVRRVHKRTSCIIRELGKMCATDDARDVKEVRDQVLHYLELLPMPYGVDHPAELARQERYQLMDEQRDAAARERV